MADGHRQVRDYLRTLMQSPSTETSDAQLLERFVLQHDEAAFTALLQRHGPLVWSVCLRQLQEEHAAEDAFQATFLVLVRKASSVSKRASLSSWLYGVALRVAARARKQEIDRRNRERSVPTQQVGDFTTEVAWKELRPMLDEEIQRLPEKYRLPVVLCYLEGQTNDEAARVLNCPRGTIATRLARARDQLRLRLAHRGLTLSAGSLTVLLSEKSRSAAMPAPLVHSTVKATSLLVEGTILAGTVPASVIRLMEGVLHAMSLNRFFLVMMVLALLVASGWGGAIGFYLLAQTSPPANESNRNPPAIKALEKEDPLQALLQDRLKYAEEEVRALKEQFLAGRLLWNHETVARALGHLLKAELEMSKTKAARIAAHEKYLKELQELVKVDQARFEEGKVEFAQFAAAQYFLADAKIELEREKRSR